MLSFEKLLSRFISPLQGKRKKVKVSLDIGCEKKNKPQLQQPFVTFVFLHHCGHPVGVKLAFSREGSCLISKPWIQTCGWLWVMRCCMEQYMKCVWDEMLSPRWEFWPAGGLAFPVVQMSEATEQGHWALPRGTASWGGGFGVSPLNLPMGGGLWGPWGCCATQVGWHWEEQEMGMARAGSCCPAAHTSPEMKYCCRTSS